MIHLKNKSRIWLSIVTMLTAISPALALTDADREEVMTSCQDKLRSTWGRLQFPNNMSCSVQFKLLPDGGYSSPQVISTSGNKLIDVQALNAVDAACPFQKFVDAPFDVIANFYVGTKNDVVVSTRGGPASSMAERKIAIHKKYHQNSINIMVDRIVKAEKVLGKDSPKLWESLNFLANEYKIAGDFDKSQATYQRALTIAQKESPESPHAARTIVGMGELALERGERAKAEEYFKQVIDMQKLPPGSELTDALKNTAKLLYKDGKTKEADEIYARIRTIGTNSK